jgi:hypothetical protein
MEHLQEFILRILSLTNSEWKSWQRGIFANMKGARIIESTLYVLSHCPECNEIMND